MRRFALVFVLALLFAYPASRLGVFDWPRAYDPLALPDLAHKPNFLTTWQMKLVDANPVDCALVLNRVNVSAVLKADKGTGGNCPVVGAIALEHLWKARLQAEDTRCAIAARLYLWERHVVQPAAVRILGEPIAEILHFGSFSCRTMRGNSNMSEHATANAFDISGFRLQSGRLISVKKQWNAESQDSVFLHTVRQGLCENFNLTLSPDYNADHVDHFHVDMGWIRDCR